MSSNIQKRKKIRALEAKRDKLTEEIANKKTDLLKTRAELKNERSKR